MQKNKLKLWKQKSKIEVVNPGILVILQLVVIAAFSLIGCSSDDDIDKTYEVEPELIWSFEYDLIIDDNTTINYVRFPTMNISYYSVYDTIDWNLGIIYREDRLWVDGVAVGEDHNGTSPSGSLVVYDRHEYIAYLNGEQVIFGNSYIESCDRISIYNVGQYGDVELDETKAVVNITFADQPYGDKYNVKVYLYNNRWGYYI